MAAKTPFPIENATAVITGAASGIGRALALDLARRKGALALVDRDGAGLAAVAAQARESGVAVTEHMLDVADAAAVKALPAAVVASHGRVNLLVNNAGVGLMGTFQQLTAEEFDWLFAINFTATVQFTRAFLPLLLAEPVAQLVNLSSIFGIVAPSGNTAYCAAKFAVRGFSESLRHELETTGVGVTVVHPGGVATNIARDTRVSATIDPEDAKRAIARFSRGLVTSPEAAAARIIQGIIRRERRVLVGRDAIAMDRIQRLAPTGYWAILRKRMGARPQ